MPSMFEVFVIVLMLGAVFVAVADWIGLFDIAPLF